jgi:hypothetical protein
MKAVNDDKNYSKGSIAEWEMMNNKPMEFVEDSQGGYSFFRLKTEEDKYNEFLKSQWSKELDDDTLRKGYDILARQYSKKWTRKYLNDHDIFRMNTYKEILIERRTW